LWLVVPAAIQTTEWFHTNRIGLSPAAMVGMQLGVQMPAGIDGAVRMPTTTQGQTLCSCCSAKPAT
jgi:hypothetical protein